jgi:hypothetical protein
MAPKFIRKRYDVGLGENNPAWLVVSRKELETPGTGTVSVKCWILLPGTRREDHSYGVDSPNVEDGNGRFVIDLRPELRFAGVKIGNDELSSRKDSCSNWGYAFEEGERAFLRMRTDADLVNTTPYREDHLWFEAATWAGASKKALEWGCAEFEQLLYAIRQQQATLNAAEVMPPDWDWGVEGLEFDWEVSR